MISVMVRTFILIVFLVTILSPAFALESNLTHSRRVPILLYHHIRQLPKDAKEIERKWSLSPEEFEQHLFWLAQNEFHPITVEQLIQYHHGLSDLPSRPVVLTFDDGWKDHYTVVYFLLKKFGFLATFFITTDSVNHSAFLNWEQLRTMSDGGMDIQAHSISHPKLTKISKKQGWKEIVQSKKVLERRLRKKVSVFAYPFGYFNPSIVAMVQRAGYRAAVTVIGISKEERTHIKNSLYVLDRYAIVGGERLEKLKDYLLSE